MLEDDPNNKHNLQWVAILLAALASVLSNLGLNLQKLDHLKHEDNEAERHNYYKHKTWVLGLALIIVGSVADFVALGFGAQIIVAPLGSLTLVANVFWAPLLLGETVTRRDILATITIVSGASTTVYSAYTKEKEITYKKIFSYFAKPRFLIYAAVCLGVGALVFLAISRMNKISNDFGVNSRQYKKVVKLHRFLYGALSGTVGAQSVLFAKCTAELVVESFKGEDFFFLWWWQTYLIIGGMSATIFYQIKWLNEGFQRFDVLYIVPIFQSFWISVSVLSGLIFFGEAALLTGGKAYLFTMGLIMTISGVYVLSAREVAKTKNENLVSDVAPLLTTATSNAQLQDNVVRIDPTIGYMGTGPPATFSGSSMGRCSAVYVKTRTNSQHADERQASFSNGSITSDIINDESSNMDNLKISVDIDDDEIDEDQLSNKIIDMDEL